MLKDKKERKFMPFVDSDLIKQPHFCRNHQNNSNFNSTNDKKTSIPKKKLKIKIKNPKLKSKTLLSL